MFHYLRISLICTEGIYLVYSATFPPCFYSSQERTNGPTNFLCPQYLTKFDLKAKVLFCFFFLSLFPDADFEVLRRDICCDLARDNLSELRGRGLREGLQAHLSHPDTRPGEALYYCSLQ